MSTFEVSVQFWPWNTCTELIAYGAHALKTYRYDHLWMCDEFQYEDSITTLAAMAPQLDVSLGTLVTFPWRNPLELAQRFATIARLMQPGRHVAIGLGAGGAVQTQVTSEKMNPVSVVEESVIMLRSMLGGETVELSRFPKLAGRFRYNTETHAKLYFPPPQKVPVYLAAGGSKMIEVAGRHADGAILTQLVVRTSLASARAGVLAQDVRALDEARCAADPSRPFKKIYVLHLSVDRDGDAARQSGKRNTSYGLTGTYFRHPEILDAVGLDREEVGHVADAYRQGLGVEEAARRVSDELLERAGLVSSGTPDQVIGHLLELKGHLSGLGFEHLVIGVPLGPSVPAALDLIGKEVLPAIMD